MARKVTEHYAVLHVNRPLCFVFIDLIRSVGLILMIIIYVLMKISLIDTDRQMHSKEYGSHLCCERIDSMHLIKMQLLQLLRR